VLLQLLLLQLLLLHKRVEEEVKVTKQEPTYSGGGWGVYKATLPRAV
jgi:hypothetical protein